MYAWHILFSVSIKFLPHSLSHTHTFRNPYCFWTNTLTSTACVLQAASLPERGRGFAWRQLRRHFGLRFTRDGQNTGWLRHWGFLAGGTHTQSRGALIAVRRMVRCVCVCVCEERSPLFGCCSGGTGSSPHLPVPTHTLPHAACMLSLRTVSMETPEPGGTWQESTAGIWIMLWWW